jgi:hypothetical protein
MWSQQLGLGLILLEARKSEYLLEPNGHTHTVDASSAVEQKFYCIILIC